MTSFGPYTRHSPHYIYHSAFSQINQLRLIWDQYDFGIEQRHESAQGLFREWQKSGSDSTADDYLQQQRWIAGSSNAG